MSGRECAEKHWIVVQGRAIVTAYAEKKLIGKCRKICVLDPTAMENIKDEGVTSF
jgi:hypothetical protein